ncbi:MAG: uroporphyrinogen-III synthase [Pseudomonadota bacterium]
MPLTTPLAGKTIIVTRPLAQAQKFLEQLEVNLATTVHFPVLSISAIENISDAQRKFKNLQHYQTVIFISANAVHYAIDCLKELSLDFKDCTLAAVGPATKHALEHHGYDVNIVPQSGFNSEALLADPALTEVRDKNILIIRGQGGREQLRENLVSRGANVDYAEVYQRQAPSSRNPVHLNELISENCAVLLYSTESAQNMWSLCTKQERQWLTNVKFIVGSQRIAEAITRVGCINNSIIAENTSDEAMLDALVNYFKTP